MAGVRIPTVFNYPCIYLDESSSSEDEGSSRSLRTSESKKAIIRELSAVVLLELSSENENFFLFQYSGDLNNVNVLI